MKATSQCPRVCMPAMAILQAVAGDFSEGQSMQQTKAYLAGRWIGEVLALVAGAVALVAVNHGI